MSSWHVDFTTPSWSDIRANKINGKVTPGRVQRRRTKGWRTPEGAIYVGPPTKWGNPYEVLPAADEIVVHPDGRDWWVPNGNARAVTVEMYRKDLEAGVLVGVTVADVVRELAGAALVCWCPLDGRPCHADVLLELANRESTR